MYKRIDRSVLDTGLPNVLKEFADVYAKLDSREFKLYLFQQAYDAIVEAIRNGYYKDEDFVGEAINYSEICEWCNWPDLQDNGVFERAIDAAWNVARYANGIVPLEVMPYIKKYGRLS